MQVTVRSVVGKAWALRPHALILPIPSLITEIPALILGHLSVDFRVT